MINKIENPVGQRVLVKDQCDQSIREAVVSEYAPSQVFIRFDPLGWRKAADVSLLEVLPSVVAASAVTASAGENGAGTAPPQ